MARVLAPSDHRPAGSVAGIFLHIPLGFASFLARKKASWHRGLAGSPPWHASFLALDGRPSGSVAGIILPIPLGFASFVRRAHPFPARLSTIALGLGRRHALPSALRLAGAPLRARASAAWVGPVDLIENGLGPTPSGGVRLNTKIMSIKRKAGGIRQPAAQRPSTSTAAGLISTHADPLIGAAESLS